MAGTKVANAVGQIHALKKARKEYSGRAIERWKEGQSASEMVHD